MAGLSPHWECLDRRARGVLSRLGRQADLTGAYYLAGGTALALQAGHRRSVDLDFFSPRNHLTVTSPATLLRSLRRAGMTVGAREEMGLLRTRIDGVEVSFLPYPYPMIRRYNTADGVRLAHPVDIGLMKLSAVMQRTARKDFIDLACILTRYAELRGLVRLMRRKYPGSTDVSMGIARALVDTRIVDMQPDPVILDRTLTWPHVKAILSDAAERLLSDGLMTRRRAPRRR